MVSFSRLRKRVGGYMERKRSEGRIIEQIRREEALKQRMETARYREKMAGERRRKYFAAGGFGGELRRGFGGVAQAFKRPSTVKKTKHKKKYKRKHRKPSYKVIDGVRYIKYKRK